MIMMNKTQRLLWMNQKILNINHHRRIFNFMAIIDMLLFEAIVIMLINEAVFRTAMLISMISMIIMISMMNHNRIIQYLIFGMMY